MPEILWMAAGVLLALVEIVAPIGVFVRLGLAAGFVGVVVHGMCDLDLAQQSFLFDVIASMSFLFGGVYPGPRIQPRPRVDRPRPLPIDPMVGQDGVMTTAMRDGHGAVRVGGRIWPAVGPHMAAGTRVHVVASSGAVVRVEPMPPRPAQTPAPRAKRPIFPRGIG